MSNTAVSALNVASSNVLMVPNTAMMVMMMMMMMVVVVIQSRCFVLVLVD